MGIGYNFIKTNTNIVTFVLKTRMKNTLRLVIKHMKNKMNLKKLKSLDDFTIIMYDIKILEKNPMLWPCLCFTV